MKPIGKKIIRLESVDSTNNYTANLIKEGNISHGTVILAVEQYQGRGQRSSVWLAKPGENLTASVFMDRVNLSVGKQFQVTKLIALSVVDFLESIGVSSSIKWPNDIYVNSKKIAGILIENSIGSSTIKQSIVGIGLNVNQVDFQNLQATSIKKEKGLHYSIDDALFSLIGKINDNLELLLKMDELDRLYLKKMYLINEPSMFEVDAIRCQGTIKGVNEEGKLMVVINGELQSFDMKEIKFIPRNEF